jgi:chemotaxis protein CheD
MYDTLGEQFATNIYYDRFFDRDAAKILPGEFFFTSKDMLIVTVLGSCVAACIRDCMSGIGGMNHFMLPHGGELDSRASMRYGAYAMEVLIRQLIKAGARRENLEAKVFGGGAVLRGFNAMNVGARNAQFVLEYLRAENIRVLAEDLNNSHARKVYFFPRSGRVLVKRIERLNNDTLARRELDYASRLDGRMADGDPGPF